MLIIQFFSCPSKRARTQEQDIIIFTYFIRETNLNCPLERTVSYHLINPRLLSFFIVKKCVCKRKKVEVTTTYLHTVGTVPVSSLYF
jgi:hypothetical protein